MSKKANKIIFRNLLVKVLHPGVAFMVICPLLVSLTGCAQPATAPPEPVTISFAYPDWYGEHFDALVDEFHELNPHITVELNAVPRMVYVQSFWAGDADAFVGATRLSNLRMMQDQDLIMDLSPFMQSDAAFNPEDFYAGKAAFLTDEGRIWGVPFGSSMTVMYYNRDLFDRYGVAYPQIGWTWDDFLNAALSLRDPDADVFGYVVTRPEQTANFIYQHGGRLYDDLRGPTTPTYNEPLTVEAMTWYADLFHEHDVVPTPDQLRVAFGGNVDDGAYIAIRNGQAGMWMGELWQQGGRRRMGGSEWEFAWGMAPLPRDDQAATLVTTEQLFIFADARNPNECWQWLSFVSQHYPPDWLAPMRSSLGESEDYETLVSDEVAAIVRASMPDIIAISPQADGEMGAFRQVVDRIVTGRNTPQEAMDWGQQEAEKKFLPK
jgi:multiple sugar transport system substrate-binding protein